MATGMPIDLRASDASHLSFSVPNISDAQAKAASKLLTENHERHHIFFNDKHFHNHIAHHLLTIYGLGASPEELQKQYDHNTDYQSPLDSVDEKRLKDLSNSETFKSSLGKGSNYSHFLAFFASELKTRGTSQTLDKYLFSGTPQADDMLARLFGGVIHPLLHFGFALETQSIPLMAEALAMTAVHQAWLMPFFLEAEEAAKKSSAPPKTLFELLNATKADESLLEFSRKEGLNILEEFTSPEALPKAVALAAQYRIDPSSSGALSSLQTAVAEQMSTLAYAVIGSHRAAKQVRLDFYFIHTLNASLFFPLIISSPHIPAAAAQRLVEWKARSDALLYAHLHSPTLHPETARDYKPRPEHGSWDAIFHQACDTLDDGHMPKVIRALAAGERYCAPYDGEEWCLVKKDQWRTMAALTLDATRSRDATWVFNVGKDEAWADIPARL